MADIEMWCEISECENIVVVDIPKDTYDPILCNDHKENANEPSDS